MAAMSFKQALELASRAQTNAEAIEPEHLQLDAIFGVAEHPRRNLTHAELVKATRAIHAMAINDTATNRSEHIMHCYKELAREPDARMLRACLCCFAYFSTTAQARLSAQNGREAVFNLMRCIRHVLEFLLPRFSADVKRTGIRSLYALGAFLPYWWSAQ